MDSLVEKTSQTRHGEAFLERPTFVFLLCLLASVLVYAPALGGDLVWDDFYLVRENAFFRSPNLAFEAFRHFLFLDSFSTYYRPIQNWSYCLDYWFWRGEPLGYHFTNVALHGGSGFLLLLLLRRLLPDLVSQVSEYTHRIVALLLGLIWVVHPIHNAAVAYISGRADSLAACFCLSAWLLVLRALDSKGLFVQSTYFVCAAGLCLLGLCSKEIALVWLVLLVGQLFVFDRRHTAGAKWKVLAGVVAVLGVYGFLHSLPEHLAAMAGGGTAPWPARFLLMLRALGDYGRLILFPGRLYMERTISDPSIYRTVVSWQSGLRYEYLSLIGALILAGAGWLMTRKGPNRKLIVFGASWFAVAFLPISNLFPLNAEVAEHWIYLASIGALLFLAGVVLSLPTRGRRISAFLTVGAIAALGARTYWRSGDWVNAEIFCQRTIEDGGATPRILGTLASVYAQRGDLERQERVLRRMIQQFPDYTPARLNLGLCLTKAGRLEEAETLLKAARVGAGATARQFPRTWPAALQLALLRRDDGETDEALAILREARSLFPENWELVKAESEILRDSQKEGAIKLAAEFAARHWWHFDAQITLGALLFSAGRHEEGIAALRAASRLDVHDGQAFAGIAEIELARGRGEAALEAQLTSMARDPDQPKRYAALANILQSLGRKNEAQAAWRKAHSLAAARHDAAI